MRIIVNDLETDEWFGLAWGGEDPELEPDVLGLYRSDYLWFNG